MKNLITGESSTKEICRKGFLSGLLLNSEPHSPIRGGGGSIVPVNGKGSRTQLYSKLVCVHIQNYV